MRRLCKEGNLQEALYMLANMHEQGIQDYGDIYMCLLQECMNMNSIEGGKQIHAHIIQNKYEEDIFVWNTLLTLYVKSGSMLDAHQTFHLLVERNVVTWNAMIAGYVQHGLAEEALQLFWKLKCEEVRPDEVTFLSTFKACAMLQDVEQGKKVHAEMVECVLKPNDRVGNTLIDMYAKCGSIANAHQMFKGMLKHTIVSWNVMISGFVQHGNYDQAFELFGQMNREGLKPDDITFVVILKVCVNLGVLEWGKHIHGHSIKSGVDCNIYIANTLVDMYAKCGSVDDARQVFDKMSKRDVISWNAMIAGYTLHGHGKKALDLFKKVEQEGMKLEQVTFLSTLKACAILGALDSSRQIHDCLVKSGINSNILVLSTLVDMYAKCGSVHDARKIFDSMPKHDVVTWNAVISGYAQNGLGEEALKLFMKMQQEGLKPDEVTFLSILKVCSLADLYCCKHLHGLIAECGFESDLFVGSTLVDMYAKCGSMEDAHQVFSKMTKRNVVSWNAMLGACAQQGHGEEALEFFNDMEEEGVQPDEITFVNVLGACANLGALDQGKRIHNCVTKSAKMLNIFVGNALVDMYVKCGSLDDALEAFDKMPEHDVVSWNALISGYALHGHGNQVLRFVEEMCKEGVKLNHITFVGILTACSHTGLVHEGRHYFDSMRQEHGIIPTAEHYACMVDIFGRAGLLDEAANVIGKMHLKPTAVVWMALLGACRIYCNMELAFSAAEHVLALEPQKSAAFVLVSNIYAAGGMWEEDQDQKLDVG